MNEPLVPRAVFFTKGVGRHKEKLASFEDALRVARIAQYNLVYVSSILPPKCTVLKNRDLGLSHLHPGGIVFTVMARIETNEPHRLIGSSIGLAIPKDRSQHGYLSEHHTYGCKEKVMGDYAEDLAATMLATTLGIKFDPNTNYDSRREVYKMSGKIVRSTSVTQTAVGKEGLWITAIAAAVFIL